MKYAPAHYFWIVCLLLAWSSCDASQLSYPTIKSLYKEGEFEKIKSILERFLKENDSTAQNKDKVFAFKYLGVVYATDPNAFLIAETYFFRLLELAPNAHLSDLYVSGSVKNLFEKTKERYRKENRELSNFDEFGNPTTLGGVSLEQDSIPEPQKGPNTSPTSLATDSGSAKPKTSHPESKNQKWAWIAGGVAVTVVGGFLWYLSQEKKESVVTIYGPQK
jgi:tetratricopeptide (TPR) repeat protein